LKQQIEESKQQLSIYSKKPIGVVEQVVINDSLCLKDMLRSVIMEALMQATLEKVV